MKIYIAWIVTAHLVQIPKIPRPTCYSDAERQRSGRIKKMVGRKGY